MSRTYIGSPFYLFISVEMAVCKVCGKCVSQVSRHYARMHQQKFWGYRCPDCPVVYSKLDASFMRRHLKSHGKSISLLSCRVVVPDGYIVLRECPICRIRTFTDEAMADHFFECHPPRMHQQSLEELLEAIKDEEMRPVYEDISPPPSPAATARPVALVTHKVVNGNLLPIPQFHVLEESIVYDNT